MLQVTPSSDERIWRVEDSLVDLGAVRPLAFMVRNAHRYSERWKRFVILCLLAAVRMLLYATSPVLAARVLHACLRGMSRDRLDVLGEEYFNVYLKHRLKRTGLDALQRAVETHGSVVLVSQGLEHIVRPLAKYLGVQSFIANRLDFQDGSATGRLLDPVVHSRGGIARLASRDSQGSSTLSELAIALDAPMPTLRRTMQRVDGGPLAPSPPLVLFDEDKRVDALSVRQALAGRNVLLIGVTGFIGKVWFARLLETLPDIGHIYLLIRRQRAIPALRRFEHMMETSPLFETLHQRLGRDFERFISERVTVVEGDASKHQLGLSDAQTSNLQTKLDLVINSGGLTEFNPDLRNALSANVESARYMLDFIRSCKRAALLHLSTAYVVGRRDGRITEELQPNYVPLPAPGFDVDDEQRALQERVSRATQWPPNRDLVAELAAPTHGPEPDATDPSEVQPAPAAATQPSTVRAGSRFGWIRKVLTESGTHRAQELGWPNSYVFTKSLGESILAKHGQDLRIAIVRPSIVETSVHSPFRGWNEGINTSAPLSYLLGTTFRQLPANERKCLDVIPVDLVCRGMTLVAAALIQGCHQPVYQLASSVDNPCNMKRAIELTSLAHRKHYGEQRGARRFWKMRMDAIPVSKTRYQRLSAPRHKAIIRRVRKWLSPMPFKVQVLARAERAISRVAKLVEIYEPFILENEHVFEAENVRILSQALPENEKQEFAYEPRAFDWREYWINVHIPALRRWCYPLIEGRSLDYPQRRSFRYQATVRPAFRVRSAAPGAGDSGGEDIGREAIGT